MINIFGPANFLGIGIHTYHVAKALHEADKVVALFPPFGNVNRVDMLVESWLENRKFFKPDDPSIMIFDSQFFPHFSGRPRIGFAVFETDSFTPLQIAALKSCDFLLTPSMWGASVLEKHGMKNFAVVREGFDPEEFPSKLDEDSRLSRERATGPFRFLHVGKWEERKGSKQVVRCFFEEFEHDDAELVMHCENPFNRDWFREAVDMIEKIGFKRNILGENQWRRQGISIRFSLGQIDSLRPLYQSADCGVFPSKGEGWGLP